MYLEFELFICTYLHLEFECIMCIIFVNLLDFKFKFKFVFFIY